MLTPSSDVQLAQQLDRVHRTDGAGDPPDAADTLRFRAPTLEGAIALAETSLGSRVRVVAANRIRRGGIGGFFASDLGVEVTVALDDETMEDALARLVAESDADERAHWTSTAPRAAPTTDLVGVGGLAGAADAQTLLESFASIAARVGVNDDVPLAPGGRLTPAMHAGVTQPDDDELHAVNPVLAEVLAAIMAEAAQAQDQQTQQAPLDEPEYTPEPALPIVARRAAAPLAPTAGAAPAARSHLDTGRRPVYATPPTMMRVEQIIEELSAITAAPVFSGERSQPRVPRPRFGDRLESSDPRASEPAEIERPITRPKVLPTLPPRASEIARAASAASAASHARLLQLPEHRAAVEPVGPGETAEVVVTDEVFTDEVVAESVAEGAVESAAHDRAVPDGIEDVGATRADDVTPRRLHVPARHSTIAVAGNGTASTQAPSRRHVELAVAATDQLIESLKREDGVKRLSVRVVLRTGDHREVEAEAEWESE